MSLAGRKRRRQSEIVQRMKRRAKVAKIKAKIVSAKTEGDKVICSANSACCSQRFPRKGMECALKERKSEMKKFMIALFVSMVMFAAPSAFAAVDCTKNSPVDDAGDGSPHSGKRIWRE